jgi:hypothetical protein
LAVHQGSLLAGTTILRSDHTASICCCACCSDSNLPLHRPACLRAELGHWKLRHTPINFVMSQFITLANFLLFAGMRTAPGLFESFGFDKSRPAFIAFVLFQFVVAPVDEVRLLLLLLGCCTGLHSSVIGFCVCPMPWYMTVVASCSTVH